MLAAAVATYGCGPRQPTSLDGTDAASTTTHPQAFTVEINTRVGSVAVRPPAATRSGSNRSFSGGVVTPSLSLLAGDVLTMRVSNLRVSAVAASSANRVRATFDVAIENRLAGIRLTTPTWPSPPANGVILVPIGYTVTSVPGSVSGDNANALTVSQPSSGRVVPSGDFDGTGDPGSGAPFSFFNDATCTDLPTSDCFRWKAFETSIAPRAASSSRTVGFEMDATVAQFRAFMIVAADLVPDVTSVSMHASRSRSPSP